jgi:PAS domain S-box-containing protein
MAAGRVLAELGLTPESMIGKTHAELYPPEVVAAVEEPFRRALAGETTTGNVPLGHLTYTLSAAPLDQVDGTVRTIVVVAQDITERVRAERERAEQRERQARLEGMLFAARQLADRMKDDLAQSSGAIDLLRPQPTLPAELRDAMETVVAKMSDVRGGIAELERLIHRATLEPAARSLADDRPST